MVRAVWSERATMGGEFNCNVIADHLRRHGPFEPHRLPMEEMEYTTLPEVMDNWKGDGSPWMSESLSQINPLN